MKVYFDNAATTALDPEVSDRMVDVMKNKFGNPSSIHSFGREARTIIEAARKTIAGILNVSPSEIFFTSGGTEANNTAITCAIRDYKIEHAITSPIEHHAVLHTLEEQEKQGKVKLHIVHLTQDGHVDLKHLEELLNTYSISNNGKQHPPVFVSLMHANNEIGNLLPLDKVSELCSKYNALLHTDTVQTMAHYKLDFKETKVHFASCSAHKFHGPKGVGFLYKSSDAKIKPFLFGGAQERNMRGGTENIYGIAGLAKAFELAVSGMEKEQHHITELKNYMIAQITEKISDVRFNGDSKNGLYTVLNVSFPPSAASEMLLFNLDIQGVACSGGSACSSGSEIGSHVLAAIHSDKDRPSVRFSFSKYNTKAEVDFCVEKLSEIFAVRV